MLFLVICCVSASSEYFKIAGYDPINRAISYGIGLPVVLFLNESLINSTIDITSLQIYRAGSNHVIVSARCYYEGPVGTMNLRATDPTNVTIIASGYSNNTINVSGCEIGDFFSIIMWNASITMDVDGTGAFRYKILSQS